MHIDKYLCDVETPCSQPGPFSNRLKYELKQTFFDRRFSNIIHYIYSIAIFCLLFVCSVFIFNPHAAHKVNSIVFGEKDSTLDMILLTENDIDISNFPANIRTVSNQMNSALPFIEEDKSYLVHKFKNHENKTLIYISEVRPKHSRTLY